MENILPFETPWIDASKQLPVLGRECFIFLMDSAIPTDGQSRYKKILTGVLEEKSHMGLLGQLISEKFWFVHIISSAWTRWQILNGGIQNETRIVTHWMYNNFNFPGNLQT